MSPAAVLTLQDAIHWVDHTTQADDPLMRLQTASALVHDLAEIGDASLGYFVDQARHAGCSWSEIGDALGVSKQAAQQKHTVRLSFGPNAPTLEHLTPRARNVLSEAEEIARGWGHAYVGTEHLLLALYHEPKGIGAQLLVGAGLPQRKAQSAVVARVQRGTARTDGDVTFTPRALAAFSCALSSALAMNHNYIGTEHLLLGLAQGDGVAAQVLRDGGLTEKGLTQKLEKKLARFTPAGSAAKIPRKRTPASKASASNTARTARKARRK
jgi:hypothetical protein